MCYHVSIPEWSEIDALLDNAVRNDEWNEYFHHVSSFSYAKLPVLTAEDPTKINTFHWGLIPFWTRDHSEAERNRKNTFNAKSETIFTLPSFKGSIGKKRCLVFVNGFYEWREYNKTNYPYLIKLKNQGAFALGGIYDSWTNKDTGEITNTVSIITTAANPLMAKIHNKKERMPLIFDKDTMGKWIDPTLSKEQIATLMIPFDETQMESHTISKLITSRKESSNVPKVKELCVYEELPPL